MGITKISDLVKADIFADIINDKLEDEIKFAPLASVDTSLIGQPGDTVKLPKFSYIGDATDVTEGSPIPIVQLTATAESVTVKKAAKGIEITDEAALSGYGDPVGSGAVQLKKAVAQKVDADCYNALDVLALK